MKGSHYQVPKYLQHSPMWVEALSKSTGWGLCVLQTRAGSPPPPPFTLTLPPGLPSLWQHLTHTDAPLLNKWILILPRKPTIQVRLLKSVAKSKIESKKTQNLLSTNKKLSSWQHMWQNGESLCFIWVFWFIFWPRHSVYRILGPQAGIEPGPSTVKAQSPNHWTTRELPLSASCCQLYYSYNGRGCLEEACAILIALFSKLLPVLF